MILINKIRRCAPNGSVKQRVIAVFCGLIFCAVSSSASKAAQTYQCEFEYLSRPDKGRSGEWKLEISGDVLKAIVKALPPYREAGRMVFHTETRYKILLRNEVGIVAAQLKSQRNKDVGPLVGARILSIRLSDGAMREGTVDAGGVYDLSKGRCK